MARAPRLPDSDVPTGRVWPPITGRLFLHEIPAEAAEPRQGPDGSWRVHLQSWFFHSAREHHFFDLDEGRQELLRWARLHNDTVERLAPRRCVVLAATGPEDEPGSWRLWQLVHHEPSLRETLWAALTGTDPEALAGTLFATATDLLAAREILAQGPPLPCRLELLGRLPSSVAYVGILPPPSWTSPAGELPADAGTLLLRELRPVLQKGLAASRIDVTRVLAALGAARDRAGASAPPDLPAMLTEILTGLESRS